MKFCYTVLAVAFLLFIQSCTTSNQKELPNIIIVFVDDQGYSDLGCYGAKGFETPHIDQLAREGMRFTNFLVSEAVCSASRASLLTGCYAQRLGVRGAFSPAANTGLARSEQTIASLLKQKNYATSIIGKWHLGHHEEFLPHNYGFDEYYGLPYSNDMWPVDYEGKPILEGHKTNYPPLPLIKGSKVIDTIADLGGQDQLTKLYTEEALDFIKRKKDGPFFLYLAHTMVHVPLGASEQFKGKTEYGLYGDAMEEIDWSVGQITKLLESLNIHNSTLIIYTSDNGPWLNYGEHGGTCFPLRGGKGNMFEGGVRVPGIIKWPGETPAGSEYHHMISSIDILPTLAEITGAPLSNNRIDGMSMLPVIKGETTEEVRDEYLYYYVGALNAVRKGPWKLFVPHKYRSYVGVEAGRNGFPGKYSVGETGYELYNLVDDISEQTDLAEEYSELVASLKQMADSSRKVLGDRITKAKGTEIRPPDRRGTARGKVEHKAKGIQYVLAHEPEPIYSGVNPYCLTDGALASYEFNDGMWLGFFGEDLEISMDFNEVIEIDEVKASFLQNQTSWIFFPVKMQVFTSNEGNIYQLVDEIDFEQPTSDFKAEIIVHSISGLKLKTRYLKVKIHNLGECPEWHAAKDNPSWLFVDELVVH